MPYTFKLTGGTADETQIARVRDEIDDVTSVETPVEGRDYFLSDERILRRLADVAGEALTDVNRALLASASALETLATNQAYILKKKKTMEQETDGPAVANSIRKHAEALRKRVEASEARIASEAIEAENEATEPPYSRSVRLKAVWRSGGH